MRSTEDGRMVNIAERINFGATYISLYHSASFYAVKSCSKDEQKLRSDILLIFRTQMDQMLSLEDMISGSLNCQGEERDQKIIQAMFLSPFHSAP